MGARTDAICGSGTSAVASCAEAKCSRADLADSSSSITEVSLPTARLCPRRHVHFRGPARGPISLPLHDAGQVSTVRPATRSCPRIAKGNGTPGRDGCLGRDGQILPDAISTGSFTQGSDGRSGGVVLAPWRSKASQSRRRRFGGGPPAPWRSEQRADPKALTRPSPGDQVAVQT